RPAPGPIRRRSREARTSIRRRSCRRSYFLLSQGYGKAALANGGDHVRPDAAFDRSLVKSTLQSFRRRFRGGFPARSITGPAFVPQRSALTVGNRRIARRGGAALAVDRCG